MNTMCKISRQVVILMIALVVLQSLSFAADVRIPAKVTGPTASLEAAGKSAELLPFLKDEEGKNLDPADNGRWPDKSFFLPEDARPDRTAYLNFLAAIHGKAAVSPMVRQSSIQPASVSCPKPTECPKCPQPATTTVTKDHPLVQTSEEIIVEVGQTVSVAGFVGENNKAHDAQGDMSVADVVKSNQVGSRFEITGKKVGVVTLTFWPKEDTNIHKVVNIEVIPSKTQTESSESLVIVVILALLSAIGLVLLGLKFMSARQADTTRRSEEYRGDSTTRANPPENSAQSDDFEREHL
jgi:hypothetical protein